MVRRNVISVPTPAAAEDARAQSQNHNGRFGSHPAKDLSVYRQLSCRGDSAASCNGFTVTGNTRAEKTAAKYRERAKELRELAATMRSEHHRKLLLDSAEKYEELAEKECKSS